MKKILVVTCVLVVMGVVTLPVLAIPPDHETIPAGPPVTYPVCYKEGVYDFAVRNVPTGFYEITTFYDRGGNPDRINFFWNIHWEISIEGTDTVIAKSIQAGPEWVTIVDGEMVTDIVMGAIDTTHIIGQGPLSFNVGRLVFDSDWNLVFEAGNHSQITEEEICDAFASFAP
ncbi:hypothetical protein ACFLYO_00330 [Chloroflexota bacterium]